MTELKTDTTAREAVSMTKGWWVVITLITLAVPALLVGAIFFEGRLWLWFILFVVGWFVAVIKTSREMTKAGYYTDEEKKEMGLEEQDKA